MLQNKYVLKLVHKLCKPKSSLININYAAKTYVAGKLCLQEVYFGIRH